MIEELGGYGLVALSGGADSVALLCMLHEKGVCLTALHCNFHLRGTESDRDEDFVRKLCQRLDIPLLVQHFDTEVYAREHGVSIEMAARTLRYEWFELERRRLDADWIAVGHHREDQAETILLNLIRGTGLVGLGGMKPRNGYVVRPLLHLHKQEILNYLSAIGQDYVTDSSNLEREAQRNVLRLDVMPLLQKLNSKAVEHICQTANLVQSWQESSSLEERDSSPWKKDTPLSLYNMYIWLQKYTYSLDKIYDIFEHQMGIPGAVWESSTHKLLRNRNELYLQPLEEEYDMPVVEQQVLEVENPIEWLQKQPKRAELAYLDADKLILPLRQRPWQQGDRFYPFGMKGSKLVSDFLTNQKLSRFDKERQTVMLSGEDICWVVGLRSDNRFRITCTTCRVMVMECHC